MIEQIYYQIGGTIGVLLGFALGFPPLLKECRNIRKHKKR